MRNDYMDQIYEEIKKTGFLWEQGLNQWIQNQLNSQPVIDHTLEQVQSFVQTIKPLRESLETIAALLNIPTKDDVARVANLVIQLEEKLDNIEDQLAVLTSAVARIPHPKGASPLKPYRKTSSHSKQRKKQTHTAPSSADLTQSLLHNLLESNKQFAASSPLSSLFRFSEDKHHE